MVRALSCSLAGAGTGFVAGFVIFFSVMSSLEDIHSDTIPICLLVGIFLAGTGAIAGAVTGGVADLLAYFSRTNRN